MQSLTARFDGPVVILKKTKSSEKETDVRPFIKNIHFEMLPDGVRINAVTRADSANYLNPVYIAKVCAQILDPDENGYYTIHRRQMLLEDGSAFR